MEHTFTPSAPGQRVPFKVGDVIVRRDKPETRFLVLDTFAGILFRSHVRNLKTGVVHVVAHAPFMLLATFDVVEAA